MESVVEIIRVVPAPFNMAIVIVAIIAVATIVTEVLKQIRVFLDHEADRRLKRDILDAGYTVDEAERLAKTKFARPKRSPGDAETAACKSR